MATTIIMTLFSTPVAVAVTAIHGIPDATPEMIAEGKSRIEIRKRVYLSLSGDYQGLTSENQHPLAVPAHCKLCTTQLGLSTCLLY